MRLTPNLLSLSLIALALIGCKREAPERYAFTSKTAYGTNLAPECDTGLNLRPVAGSQVNWEVKKYNQATGVDSPISGSNRVDGLWTIEARDLASSSASFDFDITSTDTKDKLRDDRINEYVFGLKSGLPLRFTLQNLAGPDMYLGTTGAKQVVATGVLEIAGIKSAPISLTLLVKTLKDSTTVTPAEIVRIDLRNSAPGNGMNLQESLLHILDFVPGVGMRDEVVIDFNITFEDACRG